MGMDIFVSKMVEVPSHLRERVAEIIRLPFEQDMQVINVEVQLRHYRGADFGEFLFIETDKSPDNTGTTWEFSNEDARGYIQNIRYYKEHEPEQLQDFEEDALDLADILEYEVGIGTTTFQIDLWY